MLDEIVRAFIVAVSLISFFGCSAFVAARIGSLTRRAAREANEAALRNPWKWLRTRERFEV